MIGFGWLGVVLILFWLVRFFFIEASLLRQLRTVGIRQRPMESAFLEPLRV